MNFIQLRILLPITLSMMMSCSVEPQGKRSDDGGSGTSNSLGNKKFTDSEFLCEKESQALPAEGENNTETEGEPTDEVALHLLADTTYSDVESIITTNCIGCHNPNGNEPDLTSFDLAAAASAASIAEIEAGTMPLEGPLEETDIATFRSWVDGGSLEGGSPSDSPDPSSGDAIPVDNCRNSSDATEGGTEDDGESDESESSDDDDTNDDGDGDDDDDDDDDDNSPGANLTTYNDDIKPILDTYCARAGCHNNGGISPNLTNYTSAANAAASSNAEIISGDMPQSAPFLNDAEKALFQKWVDDNTPEAAE